MVNILFLHAGAEMYGADKVMLDLIRNLDKAKYNPYVILPCDGVLVKALKGEGIDVKVIPYPIMRRKYFNLKGVFEYFIRFIRYSRQLVKVAKEKNIDMLHSNTAAVLEGIYISRKVHVPQLWSIHEIIVSPKLMFKFTSKLISRFSNTTITDSVAVKNHLEASGYFRNNDIKVIYNGVDSGRFKPDENYFYLYDEWNIPKNSKVIGMMGRVNSWKGQKDFLKAANMVMKKHPNVYTVLVGSSFEGEEWREKELKSIIKQSPYNDRIINSGYRGDSEAIYNLYDVFVLPSTNPDPLPTVVLEAMSTGKPVVGYRHGGVCEMVKDGYNGLYAEVGNSADLAMKIEVLLKDDQLRKKMGENSRKRLLEKFSIESYIKNYCNEYLRLTGK